MTLYTKTPEEVLATTTPSGAPRGADMAEMQTLMVEVVDAIANAEALAASGAYAPVAVKTIATTNVALSNGIENGDTVGGVAVATGDLVVLTGQTAPTENGLYTAVASGAASRTTGYTTGAQLLRQAFYAQAGTQAGNVFVVRNTAITVGVTSISITHAYGYPAVSDGGVTTAKLADGSVTNAKQANMAAGTVKTRRPGTGTGAPTDTTHADLKTDMAFVKGDVGLGNVDNTSDATKNAATATLTNKTLTSPVITTPTGIVKGDVGLGNVDNTSDANKPVSSATQAALNLKAALASPAFTGTPTVPTAAPGTDTTQAASTAFVEARADVTELLVSQQDLRLTEEEARSEGNPYQGVEEDFAYGVADEDGRVAIGIRSDGSAFIGSGDAQAENITEAELLGTDEPDLVWGVVDEDGRLGIGVRKDGTVVGSLTSPDSVTADADDASPIAYTKTYMTKSAVYTIDGEGNDTLLVGDGSFDAFDPIAFKNSYVKYRSDRDGTMRVWRISLDGETEVKTHDGVVYHSPWFGQSNSGAAGLGGAFFGTIAPLDTPVDEFTALMFVAGPSPNFPLGGDYDDFNSAEELAAAIPDANLATFVPLINQTALDQEGHWMGFADQVRTSAAPYLNLHTSHGVGGYAYSQLKKGTQPYENIIDSVRAGVRNAARLGLRYNVPGICLQHGEGDFSNVNYAANLAEWTADFNADIVPLTGQATPIKLWMTQPCNWAWAALTHSIMPLSPRIMLAEHEAENVILVTPTYHVLHDLGDPEQWIHISAYGRRVIGEKYAEALAFGPEWSPLRPTGIVATGSNIVLSFAGRQGALQFNEYHATTNPNGVVDPGNKGFRLTDSAGAALGGITISSATLINSDTQIQIACSTTVPAGAYVGYADAATPPVQSGPIDGPRGIVSDSDTFAPSAILQAYRKDELGQSDGEKVAPLVNWLVAFNKPVTF
jgi:hypothetical protein